MKFTIFALATVASLATAAPTSRDTGYCVCQADAETLVARYAAVIAAQPSDLGGPIKTAKAITGRNYVEQSDSANQQIGIPLGVLTTATKADFVYESQNNPPLVTQTQEVFTGGCNKVVWRWVSTTQGSGAYQVQGIHVFTLNASGRIIDARFEFNSFAGALNNGYTIFYPNGTQYGV
ncbi:hypothetical protein LTR09_008939 [Extremus antarcticus]|uniref:NTF2-like domain-containing protein n=1 Tax=Extremus antarcticus TaxID=702011 RepID=A0AAJ0DGM0_9PEZI|nr:hypothetical protein LTR09_008939 [Extremus antarcticus]